MAWTKANFPMASIGFGGPAEGLWTPTVDQRHRLGTKYEDGLGRVYRYAKNGATELAAALMTTGEATHTNVKDITQTGYTTAIGDTRIRVLFTTSNGILDDELVDGQLTVNSSTGLGHAYVIAGNKYLTSDTVVDVQLYDPIRIATSATSVFTLSKNPYRDIIVAATTPTAVLTGVPTIIIPASYYGWVQRKGPCAMIVDTSETIAVGCLVGLPATSDVAGAVGVAHVAEAIYGHCMEVVAAAATALIDLNLE